MNFKKNQITVLGAYGTKAKGYGTSSFYLDKRNVIDAGNLLETLEEDSVEIENIWLTHSHLDHICDIAYILDNYFAKRTKSLNIIGLPDTIKAIKENFLNDYIWPDFSEIKMHNSKNMSVTYTELKLGVEYQLSKDSYIEAFETDHTVDSCGYIYTKTGSSILITADTYSLDNVINLVENRKNIKAVVIECSFPSYMSVLARDSKHLTPKLIFEQLKELKRDDLQLYINHIKPPFIKQITEELEQINCKYPLKIVKDEEILNF